TGKSHQSLEVVAFFAVLDRKRRYCETYRNVGFPHDERANGMSALDKYLKQCNEVWFSILGFCVMPVPLDPSPEEQIGQM
ncbi:MAG: hypothetical protein IJG33_06900, partial [Selenomonadaceae bacterium]|nr:hypothetical protein [Selenomonadaceae bacterium]